MKKSLAFIFIAMVSLFLLTACRGNKGENLSKKDYIKYLNELSTYYQSAEYQEMGKKYKEAAKGTKDLKERQKVWNQYMKPSRAKMLEIQGKYGLDNLRTLFKVTRKYSKDPEVRKISFKMMKYIVF